MTGSSGIKPDLDYAAVFWLRSHWRENIFKKKRKKYFTIGGLVVDNVGDNDNHYQ
jgi:hypothetical protein